MKTKSDVDVFINGRENRAAGFSVKYGGVRQVGQFAGSDAVKNMQDGFKNFGMDIKGLLSPITKAMGSVIGVYRDRKDPIIENDKRVIFHAVNGVFSSISKKFGFCRVRRDSLVIQLCGCSSCTARVTLPAAGSCYGAGCASAAGHDGSAHACQCTVR